MNLDEWEKQEAGWWTSDPYAAVQEHDGTWTLWCAFPQERTIGTFKTLKAAKQKAKEHSAFGLGS
jgi:hypothetical protein